MKKFLALVLALVMTMSLVTISAGAEDFTDDSAITYEEAVDVMTAIGVVGGYADGSFNPTGTLTRGAAAKIICNMILGPTAAGELATVEAPFSDVPADHVFAGYIAYCVSEGIVSGYTDGTFRPAGTLTGYAFMKMLLGALGYDSSIEKYEGANFAVNVAKRALNIDLDKGLEGKFVGSKALTREEACLYAFNALNAEIVEYPNKSTIQIGDVVISQNSEAKAVEDGWTFADEYFDNLKKVSTDVQDAFGRPGHKWYTHATKRADKYLVGTYTDTADYTVVLEKAYDIEDDDDIKKVLRDLTENDELDYDGGTTLYINGAEAETADAEDVNGAGTVVELFCDDDDNDNLITNVVAYAYTLGKIKGVDTDVSKADEKNDIAAYIEIDGVDEFDDIDFAGFDADTYVKGAYIAYIVDADDATKVIASYIPEVVTGKITAKSASYVKVDGTKYTFAGTATSKTCDFTNEFDVYVDENGYALGVIGDTAVSIDDVFYVTDTYTKEDSKLGDTIYAETISLTGEIADIVVDKDYDAGLYVVEWNDDKDWNELDAYDDDTDSDYNVAKADEFAKDIKATASSVTLDKKVYLDADTQYVSIKLNNQGFAKTVATAEGGMSYSGSNKADIIALYDSNKDAAYVLYVGKTMDSVVNTDNVVFVTAVSSEEDADGFVTDVWFMENMENETITVDTETAKDVAFYTYAIDADGIYELKKVEDKVTGDVAGDEKTGWSKIVFADAKIHDDTVTYTTGSVEFVDVDFADAEVIDLRDDATIEEAAYDREITSVSTLKKAAEDANVTAYVYVVDGEITFIAVEA